MIDRYAYEPVRVIFSDYYKLALWAQIEVDYLHARREVGDPLITAELISEVRETPTPTPDLVKGYENQYGHDVVGFLAAWTRNMSRAAQSQVHLGLTSSDLVETTLYEQLTSAQAIIGYQLQRLESTLLRRVKVDGDLVRIGRTHGQVAEPTTLGWRFQAWSDTVSDLYFAGTALGPRLRIMKTPGAVGDMRLLGEDVADAVATSRRLRLRRSTQVLPRQPLLAWAAWMVQVVTLVEEVALEIRLASRSEVGEMMEGAAYRRAGSSAMPHKRIPVGSEQLSGLGRVARGYFAALAETAGALHNERDISNSSVERTVVPDLAELTAYMVDSLSQILANLKTNQKRMAQNAQVANKDSALVQYGLQRLGVPYLQARIEAGHWADVGGWEQGRILEVVNHDREEGAPYMGFTEFREAMEQAPWRPS